MSYTRNRLSFIKKERWNIYLNSLKSTREHTCVDNELAHVWDIFFDKAPQPPCKPFPLLVQMPEFHVGRRQECLERGHTLTHHLVNPGKLGLLRVGAQFVCFPDNVVDIVSVLALACPTKKDLAFGNIETHHVGADAVREVPKNSIADHLFFGFSISLAQSGKYLGLKVDQLHVAQLVVIDRFVDHFVIGNPFGEIGGCFIIRHIAAGNEFFFFFFFVKKKSMQDPSYR